MVPGDLPTIHVLVLGAAIVLNASSGIASIGQFAPIMAVLEPSMARCGVPLSWLVFPIGTLKLAGALGLLLGLFGMPLVGTAAAAGLVLYYVCATYTHVRVGDYSRPFFGASFIFLPLAIAAFAINAG